MSKTPTSVLDEMLKTLIACAILAVLLLGSAVLWGYIEQRNEKTKSEPSVTGKDIAIKMSTNWHTIQVSTNWVVVNADFVDPKTVVHKVDEDCLRAWVRCGLTLVCGKAPHVLQLDPYYEVTVLMEGRELTLRFAGPIWGFPCGKRPGFPAWYMINGYKWNATTTTEELP